MHNAPNQILKPKTPEEAGALIQKLGNEAGLLWLGARVEPPETWARPSMIDLSDLPLNYVQTIEAGLVIGATTPLQRLVEDETIGRVFGGLVHTAARRLAHYGLRNLANVGGAVMTRQGPPELTLALLALECQAVMVGADERIIALEELWSDETAVGAGLLKEFRLPREPATGGGWGLEWLARSPMDQALAAACAAVTVHEGQLMSARLAVASVGQTAGLVGRAGATLRGVSVSAWPADDLAKVVQEAVAPDADFRASPEYQKNMMARLAVRAMAAALKKAGAR